MRSQEMCMDFTSCWLHFSPLSLGPETCGIKGPDKKKESKNWERGWMASKGSYTLQCDVIKSDSFSRVRCGQPVRIDNAVSPEIELGLRSIQNWFTSTLRLMKSVQVKLQSSRLDMHFAEPLLELTSMCRPELKPGGKLSYKAQYERDRWPLWQLYSLCLPLITPAEESQSTELKRRIT